MRARWTKIGGTGVGTPSCAPLGTGRAVCVVMGVNNKLTAWSGLSGQSSRWRRISERRKDAFSTMAQKRRAQDIVFVNGLQL